MPMADELVLQLIGTHALLDGVGGYAEAWTNWNEFLPAE